MVRGTREPGPLPHVPKTPVAQVLLPPEHRPPPSGATSSLASSILGPECPFLVNGHHGGAAGSPESGRGCDTRGGCTVLSVAAYWEHWAGDPAPRGWHGEGVPVCRMVALKPHLGTYTEPCTSHADGCTSHIGACISQTSFCTSHANAMPVPVPGMPPPALAMPMPALAMLPSVLATLMSALATPMPGLVKPSPALATPMPTLATQPQPEPRQHLH